MAMSSRVFISIALSLALGYLFYLLGWNLITGLNPFLLVAFSVFLAVLLVINTFLILREKLLKARLIMICFLLISILLSIIAKQIRVNNMKSGNGVSHRYYM